MTTHSSILDGESHGQRSLVGYSPWGCKESDMTEQPRAVNKSPGLDNFTGESYQIFKDLVPILKLLQKIEDQGTFPNSFHEASVTLIPSQLRTQEKKIYRPIFPMNINTKILKKY